MLLPFIVLDPSFICVFIEERCNSVFGGLFFLFSRFTTGARFDGCDIKPFGFTLSPDIISFSGSSENGINVRLGVLGDGDRDLDGLGDGDRDLDGLGDGDRDLDGLGDGDRDLDGLGDGDRDLGR